MKIKLATKNGYFIFHLFSHARGSRFPSNQIMVIYLDDRFIIAPITIHWISKVIHVWMCMQETKGPNRKLVDKIHWSSHTPEVPPFCAAIVVMHLTEIDHAIEHICNIHHSIMQPSHLKVFCVICKKPNVIKIK